LLEGREEVRDIAIGLRGEDGFLEIKEGIIPGDILVAPVTTSRQSQKNN
jgi:hypothetical protein